MLQDVERRLADKLPQFPPVAGAYVFGSALDGGQARDIDVGLVIRPVEQSTVTVPESTGSVDELAALVLADEVVAALGRVHDKSFDVSILSAKDPFFTMNVLRKGRRLYEADTGSVTDLIEQVSRLYAELYPRYRRALDEVLEEVRS